MLLRLCICLMTAVLALLAQAGGRGRGGPTPGGPPPPPPPSDCTVSGTVVNAITGEPIPRAMVSLAGSDAAGSATDATGHWSISNTSCTSNRQVNATHIGFINSQMMRNSFSARPLTVNLVSGSPVTGVKLLLTPESSITGKVQDPNGDPIESARIQALRVQVQAGKRTLVNAAAAPATDTQGNFRIGGLQPGRYVVCASSSAFTYPVGGGALMMYRDDCFPGPVATGVSTAMSVEAGAEVRTALTLTPAQGVHVRGRVTGLTAPAMRGNVQLMKLPTNLGIETNINAAMQEDGSFDLRTVLPGYYVATASFQTNPPGPQPLKLHTQVEVGNSDVDNVSITSLPPGSLSGAVRYQFSNPAKVANPPVTVDLRPDPAAGYFGLIPQPQWDANHLSFNFAGIQPGSELRLNAFVNAPGVYIRSATLRGQDVLNQLVTVEGAAGPVEILVSDDTGSIDVTVNDSDGHPAIDAHVILLSTSGQSRFLTSGDDGHATQQNLPTGDYRAWAFDTLTTVPYAEAEWMNQNAGPGEKARVISGSNVMLTLKRQASPKE